MASVKGICFIAALFISHYACAAMNVCTNDYGVLRCAEGSVENITHLGKAYLAGTHVKGVLKILGDLVASHAELGSIYVTGDTEAQNLTVHSNAEAIGSVVSGHSIYQSGMKVIGDLHGGNNLFNGLAIVVGTANLNHDDLRKGLDITGKLTADSTTFLGEIKISSCEGSFYHSETRDISIGIQSDCPFNLQKIHLRDKTQVKGNVIFKGGNGQVYLSGDSAVLGRVTGGVINREY